MADSTPHRGSRHGGGSRGDHPRGRGGAHRGNERGGRGGGSGGRGGAAHTPGDGAREERPRKENILDLSKYADKQVTVKFSGGREVHGVLKGYDQLMNLVLDDVREVVRDEEGNTSTRELGLLVARGTLLTSLSPVDGSEEIANPFAAADEDGEGESEEPVLA